jgi:hypothetical protein
VHRFLLATAALALLWAAPASAAGPLYIVPSHPPAASEAVGFTNDLNDRVRDLPPALDPPVAESPVQIEARIEDLERGVVIEQAAPHPERRPVGRQEDRREDAAALPAPSREPGDQPPLTAAFVAAGALAVLGLVLGLRRRRPGPPAAAAAGS